MSPDPDVRSLSSLHRSPMQQLTSHLLMFAEESVKKELQLSFLQIGDMAQPLAYIATGMSPTLASAWTLPHMKPGGQTILSSLASQSSQFFVEEHW